jgi:Fe-S cluster biogenesis protein NfuA
MPAAQPPEGGAAGDCGACLSAPITAKRAIAATVMAAMVIRVNVNMSPLIA